MTPEPLEGRAEIARRRRLAALAGRLVLVILVAALVVDQAYALVLRRQLAQDPALRVGVAWRAHLERVRDEITPSRGVPTSGEDPWGSTWSAVGPRGARYSVGPDRLDQRGLGDDLSVGPCLERVDVLEATRPLLATWVALAGVTAFALATLRPRTRLGGAIGTALVSAPLMGVGAWIAVRLAFGLDLDPPGVAPPWSRGAVAATSAALGVLVLALALRPWGRPPEADGETADGR